MVIVVRDIALSADTAEQGDLVFTHLASAAHNVGEIVVSFEGITTATSSFVNASFVELLRVMSFTDIRERIRVTNSTAQINDMIKRRLEREAMARA